MVVRGSTIDLTMPFTFGAISDAVGALNVEATDGYTYFAEGAPGGGRPS